MELSLKNKEQESSDLKKRMRFLENQIRELKMKSEETVKFDPFKMAFPGV